MSKKLLLIGLVAILALVFVVAQCGKDQKNPITPIIEPTAKIQNGVAGTTLTVTVDCTPHYTLEYGWTIDKSVTPATWNLFQGDDGTSLYTITVTKDEGTYKAWLDGKVCVTNGGAAATENLAIVVELRDGVPPPNDLIATVNVDVSSNPIIPAYTGPVCYSYHVDVPADQIHPGKTYKVTANVTITNHSGYPNEPHTTSSSCTDELPDKPTTVNDIVHVTDTNIGGDPWDWEFNSSGEKKYTKTFTCADAGKNDNTATITETGLSKTATVTVNCYSLEVTKDAETSYDRYWTWSVKKEADQSALTLKIGESFLVNYTVTFTRESADNNRYVNGNITVHNPAPMAATINGLTDVVSPAIAADVTCSVTFPYSLAAGGDLNCTYSAELPDLTGRTNTATATLQNYSYDAEKNATPSGTTDFSGTHSIVFGDPTNEYDECATVDDTYEGSSVTGYICTNTTFTYSRWVGPYDVCGDYTVENTASFVTNDNGNTGESTVVTIPVDVPCAGGCTLTYGYWKTHSSHGPAPKTDPTWGGMEDDQFYSSGQTYYQVLWTTPKGGNAYYILAHQFIAATLNQMGGASSTSAVDEALAWADNFFNNHNPDDKLSRARTMKQNPMLAYSINTTTDTSGQDIVLNSSLTLETLI